MASSSTWNSSSIDDEEEILLIQMWQMEQEKIALVLLMEACLNKRRILEEQLQQIEGRLVSVKATKKRLRGRAHNDLMNKYFTDVNVYSDADFRRRFRMRRPLFERILNAVVEHDNYFVQKLDRAGRPGLTPHLKITTALRYLCYGTAMDAFDETYAIGSSTAYESLERFCVAVIEIFSPVYLREPTEDDIERITAENTARGFPGMLGSIDCMHWRWTSCPTGEQGSYLGHGGAPTIILEAVATMDTWIWKSFFGTPGSNNDINVLQRSPVFEQVLTGRVTPHRFTVNGTEYGMGYYLADGIYPEYAAFVKSKKNPLTVKEKLFAKYQEGARKDIERTFGILQKQFAVINYPARLWKMKHLTRIMETCIILHNMIVEDEKHTNLPPIYKQNRRDRTATLERSEQFDFSRYVQMSAELRNRHIHRSLHTDLVEHVYNYHGAQQ